MPSEAAMDRLLQAFADTGRDWLLTVPATGLGRLYERYEALGRCVFATREEEAVALASGLALAAAHPVVVMQQSGAGNAINAVLSLADAYDVRFPALVCDRTTADPNPVQRVSSAGTTRALHGLGCVELDWEHPGAADRFADHVRAGVRWIVSPMVGES